LKFLTNIRAYKDEKDKLNQLARELSVIQKEKIGCPEVLRRITNVPNLPSILASDALAKRRTK
jgi:hypothetical protein